jgi:DNA replication licensing factor MCM5
MSGFDEGGVYYSDQQFVSAGASDESQLPSRAAALAKFGEFIRTFQVDPKSGAFPYADQLARCKDRLRVDIGHLSHPVYGAPELATALVENPAEYLPIFEQAAKQESQRIQSLLEDGGEPDVKDVQVMLFKSETGRSRVAFVSMRDMKPEKYVSKLVIVPGIVTSASRPKHKATYLTVQCKECKATKRIACRPGVGGAMIPRTCDAAVLPGQNNNCGMDPYIILPEKAECVDQQTLKMQVGCLACEQFKLQTAAIGVCCWYVPHPGCIWLLSWLRSCRCTDELN